MHHYLSLASISYQLLPYSFTEKVSFYSLKTIEILLVSIVTLVNLSTTVILAYTHIAIGYYENKTFAFQFSIYVPIRTLFLKIKHHI